MSDDVIQKLINSGTFANVSLALHLAMGQQSDLAFEASEMYVEMACERDGDKSGGEYTMLNVFPREFASESSKMAQLFGMLPHECFERFPFFVEKGIEAMYHQEHYGYDERVQRSACAMHQMEGRYWI